MTASLKPKRTSQEGSLCGRGQELVTRQDHSYYTDQRTARGAWLDQADIESLQVDKPGRHDYVLDPHTSPAESPSGGHMNNSIQMSPTIWAIGSLPL